MMNNSKKHFISFLWGSGLVLVLWLVRVAYSHSSFYRFLLWNLFLAFIPFAISQYMLRKNNMLKTQWWICFATWLLFFPNAPYIITDLIHLDFRSSVPIWYDAALVFTAALTGLWIGCVSLMQMETLWRKQFPTIKVRYFVVVVLLLCGFGIYLGRVLRFNSWDIITNPVGLIKAMAHRIIFPWEYVKTWCITLLFSTTLWIAYQQIRTLVGSTKED